MIDQLSAENLNILIQIGNSDTESEREALLIQVKRWDAINRLHWNSWYDVIESMDEDAHEALAKGLVMAEETHRWCGGSVAAAIWVYRSFARKFPLQAESLAEWMLAHSTNPWVPFGSDRGSARTLQEHRDQLERNATRREQRAKEVRASEDLKAMKEHDRQKLASHRESIQMTASQARADLISELKRLPVKERLEQMARDDRHPLSFYPVELVESAANPLSELDQETKNKLMVRAASIPRGPWKQWLKKQTL